MIFEPIRYAESLATELERWGRINIVPLHHVRIALLELPLEDGTSDWFTVCTDCESWSLSFTDAADALAWACPVCEEQRRAQRNEAAVTDRLVRLHAEQCAAHASGIPDKKVATFDSGMN